MPKVLTIDGSVKIGAYRFPDRKKPMLCKEEGNVITAYGSFHSNEAAENFMDEIGKMVGARFEDRTKEDGP